MYQYRLVFVLAAVLLIGAGVVAYTPAGSRPLDRSALSRLEQRLVARTRKWIQAGKWARRDGYIYTVEIGQLMAFAARGGLRDIYDSLRRHAVRHVVLKRDDEPYTRGFVLWRYRPGVDPDASGTTEALRIAEGLWLGSQAFNRPEDRTLALAVLDGYARHAATDQGIWMIRNYYNVGTGAFATNSYLVDYDPDFLGAVASATGDRALHEVARNAAETVRSAATPAGLVYDLIQPEVVTLMPTAGIRAFSPNDVVQLTNAVTVAERSVQTVPELADAVWGFAWKRRDRLKRFYYGRTGESVSAHTPGADGFAALVRLAAKRGDLASVRVFARKLLPLVEDFLEHPCEPRLYCAGEILSALAAAREAEEKERP